MSLGRYDLHGDYLSLSHTLSVQIERPCVRISYTVIYTTKPDWAIDFSTEQLGDLKCQTYLQEKSYSGKLNY